MLWTLLLIIVLGSIQAIIVGQLSIQKIPKVIYQEIIQPTLQIKATQQIVENKTTSIVESQTPDLEKLIQKQMIVISAVSLSALFVIGLISSLLISRAITKPMSNLSQQIATINVESLGTRLTSGDVDDEIVMMTQEINRTLDRLEAAFLSQERFVMDATHELRTPLSILLAQNDVLQKRLSIDETVSLDLLESQKTSIKRIEAITEDLLLLAKGEGQLPDEVINFTEMIGEICLDLGWLAQKQRVTLAYEPERNLFISASPILLDRLVRNLILNAIQYNKPLGKVNISLVKQDTYLRLKVQDTGIGIPANDLPHVFDRFYRSDRSRSRLTGGSGLGLAIVKHIALRYGARLDVASEPDEGSCFIVQFPITYS